MELLPFTTLATFTLASIGLAFSPGPDNIFVLTQGALHGRKAGLTVTLGLCSGLIGHTIAVALGVAAVFAASETAFTILKVIGALYLIYLAWGALRTKNSALAPSSSTADVPVLTNWTLYRRGVIMNITNPKVGIFFLAFLPGFTDPTNGSVTLQLFLLGFVFMAATLVCFGTIAIFAGSVGGILRRSARAYVILNQIAGLIFIGLAVRLLLTERT